MSRPFILTALLWLAATPAPGQPLPPPQPTELAPPLDVDAAPPAPPERVFISPAGEPFHAAIEAPYPSADWFARADRDRDGVLTQSEFTADALGFFASIDTDKDGRVDGFENADYERLVAPEITGVMRRPDRRGSGGGVSLWRPLTRADALWGSPSRLTPGGPGDGPAPKRQGAAQYGLLNEPHPVRAADNDFDGKVTGVEAEAAARRRFGLLDRDGDGRLRVEDLPRTPAQIAYGDDAPPPDRRKP